MTFLRVLAMVSRCDIAEIRRLSEAGDLAFLTAKDKSAPPRERDRGCASRTTA